MKSCDLLARISLFFGLAASLGCSFLIDSSVEQCSSDRDCAAVAGAICNVQRKLCERLQPAPVRCARPNKPVVKIAVDVTRDQLLTCDNDYLLTDSVAVKPGVTLSIEAGTTVLAEPGLSAILIVQPGARLVADGEPDRPIVFTSAAEPAARRPADWGGLVLLGHATTNAASPSLAAAPGSGGFGGGDDEEDSGVLRFVRIEYSGDTRPPNTELSGLTLAAIGRGTTIDHVEVRQTSHDCFGFVGGTVNAKHLVCQGSGDDGFVWKSGYRGKLQFLVVQQDPTTVDEANGFEADNENVAGNAPLATQPTIYNATLCGKNRQGDLEQYGILARRRARAHIYNTMALGFEAGLDVRDAETTIDLEGSLFWGNQPKPIAYEEDGSNPTTQKDDDGGFDEVKWFLDPARHNAVRTPNLGDCFNRNTLALAPETALQEGASAPPDDGFFDPGASYIGAFRDRDDHWAEGAWLLWSEQ